MQPTVFITGPGGSSAHSGTASYGQTTRPESRWVETQAPRSFPKTSYPPLNGSSCIIPGSGLVRNVMPQRSGISSGVTYYTQCVDNSKRASTVPKTPRQYLVSNSPAPTRIQNNLTRATSLSQACVYGTPSDPQRRVAEEVPVGNTAYWKHANSCSQESPPGAALSRSRQPTRISFRRSRVDQVPQSYVQYVRCDNPPPQSVAMKHSSSNRLVVPPPKEVGRKETTISDVHTHEQIGLDVGATWKLFRTLMDKNLRLKSRVDAVEASNKDLQGALQFASQQNKALKEKNHEIVASMEKVKHQERKGNAVNQQKRPQMKTVATETNICETDCEPTCQSDSSEDFINVKICDCHETV